MCAREAPGVERFARQHSDQVTVVGLGTQDSLELAERFVDRHGLTIGMLWDPGFTSWRELGVPGQPYQILIDGQGRELGRWSGAIPESEVLALV